MQHSVTINLLPHEAENEMIIRDRLAAALAISAGDITGFHILKKSIDARTRQVRINLAIVVFVSEPFVQRVPQHINYHNVSTSKYAAIVVGGGPAGLFAALKLIEQGIKPILIERGKNIRDRRRDLARLNKEGFINPDSNYCFGEGGAGTYSDGKLYTRSNKRGDITRILNLFVQFGADEKILYEAHPHIGTNKLPRIISNMTQQITDCGGEILFEKRVTDFGIVNGKVNHVVTHDGNRLECDVVILATGHSARDIFRLLHEKKILIEFKPFALGVRIEHPQQLIDSIQYHSETRNELLPPASYNLVQQVNGRGVFSFCMCPGGIIAPAATNEAELVVNGWSPSKRNNPFANSGMVVPVEHEDISKYEKLHGPLAGMFFQQSVEQKAFTHGGGNFVAPAQRMTDFVNNKLSANLPDCSYPPGIQSASMKDILPDFILNRLKLSFKEFGKKMKGYFTNEAIVVATESRTSSPVRIPRDADTLQHPQLTNFYPCSEGAGYAGGIVSAAMDGEKVAAVVAQTLKSEAF